MDRMWSPWRSQYIATFHEPKKRGHEENSIFTEALNAGDDDAVLIVWRSTYCFVIMNRYPYNSGHVMVVPNRQTDDFLDLSEKERSDVMQTLQLGVQVLTETVHPEGFNIGANLGKVGGAGVDNHVHFHIVPRWNGDTNFMPVIADTKVISEDMKDTLQKLRNAFREIGQRKEAR
ncbi:MAG: HIT domain-containing protein [Bacteroidota bacterium]